MHSRNDAGTLAESEPGRTNRAHRLRGVVSSGLLAALAAVAATTLAAAPARVAGADFEISEDGETIPLVPPFLVEADAATVTALLALHLVAATVMIPSLTRSLPNQTE